MTQLLFILTVLIFLFIAGGFFGAIWIPTRKKDYNRIEKLMNLKPGNTLYDLGSGTADFLFYLSNKHDIKCVGIEVSPMFYLYSKIKSLFYKNVKIKFGNFSQYNLKNADLIYVFLLSETYDKLKNKINNNAMRKNTKIILAVWPFKDIKPSQISRKEGEVSYYLYYKRDLL